MQYTLMLWHADHVNFGRLLNLLEGELAAAARCWLADYALMLDIMYYMTHYSDVCTIPRRISCLRVSRRATSSAGAAIDELTSQHAQLREMGEAMVHVLDDVVNGSIASRERVEATARAYVSGLARPYAHGGGRDPAARRASAERKRLDGHRYGDRQLDDPLFGRRCMSATPDFGRNQPAGASGQGDGALARWRELNDRHDMHDGKLR